MEIQPHDNDSVGEQSSLAVDKLLPVVVRPYPAKVAGISLRWEWEVTKGMFVFERSEPDTEGKVKMIASVEKPPLSLPGVELKARETEIFILYLLTSGRQIHLSGLEPKDRWAHNEEGQMLFVVVLDNNRKPGKRHRIEVAIAPNPYPPHRSFFVNNLWGDWGGARAGVVLGILVLVAIVPAMIFGSGRR